MNKQELQCSKCGAPLSDEKGSLCMQCSIENIEESIPEQKKRENSSSASSSKIWRYARWGIILTAIIFSIYSFLKVKKILNSERPIRNGSYETDAVTDECIQNLWQAAAFLQSHKKIPHDLVCPLCHKPYNVRTDRNGVTFVSCPDPDAHGCSEIAVNSKNLIPEVKK